MYDNVGVVNNFLVTHLCSTKAHGYVGVARPGSRAAPEAAKPVGAVHRRPLMPASPRPYWARERSGACFSVASFLGGMGCFSASATKTLNCIAN